MIIELSEYKLENVYVFTTCTCASHVPMCTCSVMMFLVNASSEREVYEKVVTYLRQKGLSNEEIMYLISFGRVIKLVDYLNKLAGKEVVEVR